MNIHVEGTVGIIPSKMSAETHGLALGMMDQIEAVRELVQTLGVFGSLVDNMHQCAFQRVVNLAHDALAAVDDARVNILTAIAKEA